MSALTGGTETLPGTAPGLAPTGTASGFALTVPASWFELDLRPQTRDASARSLVEHRVRERPELVESRAAITRLLRQQARRAWEAGAVYCACLVEPTDDGPITGAVTVSLMPAPPDSGTAGADPLAAVLERLVAKEAAREGDTWTRVGVVEPQGCGPCARSYGVEDVELPEQAGWVRTVVMQTFVPLPAEQRVLLVTCSSPVLPLAEVLLDLFEAVSSTLRLMPG